MKQSLSVSIRRSTSVLLALAAVALVAVAGGQPVSASTSGGPKDAVPHFALAAASTHCPSGTAPGVTAKQISVAATIIDLTGGSVNNATYGVPSVQDQEAYWNIVAKSINNSGGAGCRKIVMSFYQVNPIDAAQSQQQCLAIAAAQPYIVLDTGALSTTGSGNCIPAHKVFLASGYLTQDQLTKYHPYYLQIGGIAKDVAKTTVLAIKQLGYFSPKKGFKKLGLLYRNCTPSNVAAARAAYAAAGVPSSKTVSYSLGCPAGPTDTPASLQQAVLSFKSAGVTDVTEISVNDFGTFTQIAQQQAFKPQYLLGDPTFVTGKQTGADALDPTNADGAVNIMASAYGEETTPGYKPSGGTKKCDAIYKAAGQPSVYKQGAGIGGFACNYLWFVQALLNHMRTVAPSGVPAAMHSIGSLPQTYPGGPVDFAAAPVGQTYGVNFWRPIYYRATCTCWLVPNPTWYPPFK